MGSYPALAVNPPQQQQDPIGQYSKLLQLKQALQNGPVQQQILGQQAQEGQINLQQAQQQQQDQQSIRALASDPSNKGKTVGDLADIALQSGKVSPQTYTQLKKADLEQRQSLAKLTGNELSNAKAGHEATQKLYDSVMDLPDEQLAQQWPQIAQQYDAIPGNSKMPLNPQQPMTKQQLQQFGPMIAMQRTYLDEAQEKQQKAANLDKTKSDISHQRTLEQQSAAALANTEAHQKIEEKQGQQRIGIEGARLAFDKQRQGTQDNASIEAQAQQIANGDVKGISQSRNNPFARAVMARVYEINPQYSDALYNATQDLRSSKPNSMGANVGRLGTAILHGDRALQNSNGLGFSEGLLTGIGTSGTAAYKQDAEFLTGEIGQYVTGGKLTVDEGKKLSSDLMSSRQGVRDSAIHEIIGLSKGKLTTQMQQFKNATGKEFPTDRVFNDPGVSDALHKHGVIDSPQANTGGFDWNAHPVAK